MSKRQLPVSLGGIACDWIETFLVHGPGDVQGTPIELDHEFERFIYRAYTYVPDGRGGWRRKFDRAFLSRAKGRAKSELGGMLACFEALGPCRLDGFDAYGEPVGRPITHPEVLCFATEEGQAGNTYDNVVFMLQHGAAAYEYRGLDVGTTRTITADGGTIEPQTSAAKSKDGGKSTFVVFDETHLWSLPQLVKLHATVRRNLGKRKAASPWSLETSTMYAPGENSVAEATHEYAKAVADGRIKSGRLLFDHRQGPEPNDFDWDDDAQLLAALKQAYGVFAEVMDLDRLLAEIRDPQTDKQDAQRYFLNLAVSSSDRWMDKNEWEGVETGPTELADQEPIAIGFDGSRFDDSTALVGCCLEDGHLFEIGVWEKPEGPEGKDWEVPYDEVDDRLRWAMRTFDVQRVYCDPPHWRDLIGAWIREYGEDVVLEWWTNQDLQMAHALERLRTAVRAGRDVSHSEDDTVLTRHVLNAVKLVKRAVSDDRENKQRTLIRKEHEKSARKIDCAVAATLAYEARADAIAAGPRKRPGKFRSFTPSR